MNMYRVFKGQRLFCLALTVFILFFVFILSDGSSLANDSDSKSFIDLNKEINQKSQASLIITITNLIKPGGVLRLALYDSRRNYEDKVKPVKSMAVPVKRDKVQVFFKDLASGWYAIMFYYDANNNGTFDRLLGLPREQFGFSNNATPSIGGPPDFNQVKFYIPSGQKRLEMVLRAQ